MKILSYHFHLVNSVGIKMSIRDRDFIVSGNPINARRAAIRYAEKLYETLHQARAKGTIEFDDDEDLSYETFLYSKQTHVMVSVKYNLKEQRTDFIWIPLKVWKIIRFEKFLIEALIFEAKAYRKNNHKVEVGELQIAGIRYKILKDAFNIIREL